MPWIDQESCTGCGICVGECPTDAISQITETAEIDMSECIRCGVCHDVCPEDSVRHDSEKIPEIIKSNVDYIVNCMNLCAEYLCDVEEKRKCLNRMKKHYNSEKIIAERTLEEIEKLYKM